MLQKYRKLLFTKFRKPARGLYGSLHVKTEYSMGKYTSEPLHPKLVVYLEIHEKWPIGIKGGGDYIGLLVPNGDQVVALQNKML